MYQLYWDTGSYTPNLNPYQDPQLLPL